MSTSDSHATETVLSIRLPRLETDSNHLIGELQSATASLSNSGTASDNHYTQSATLWQLYSERLCTETQLSSPTMTPFPLLF